MRSCIPLPQDSAPQQARMQRQDAASRLCLPHAAAGQMFGCGKPRDTALGMSKHSQLCGTYLAGRKVSGALRFSSSSHPGTAGSHRRVKNKVGTHRLDLVQVQASREGEGRALAGSRDSPWLDCGRLERGGSCCWEHRKAFYRRLDSISIGKGLLFDSPRQIQTKRNSPWL